ncbi:hypothetical protein BDZ97DRAFT_302367 [Flammula alnicola]|nr:hypothetical protein BDZ97DRAFT_302367 [Flammula alnicola]
MRPIACSLTCSRSGSGWSNGAVAGSTTLVCGAWTQGISDSITFKFNGTAVYVNGLALTNTSRHATLDGVDLDQLFSDVQLPPGSLTCGETIYTKSGLSNAEHTLVISFIGPILNNPTGTQQSLVVQSITYTFDEGQTSSLSAISPSATSSPISATSAPTSNPTSATGATAASPSKSVNSKKVGPIAGGTVGGVGGIFLLGIAWSQSHHLSYFFSSIGFALFGWMLFSRRRFSFLSDKNVGQVEITLFLSPLENLNDSDDEAKETLLVWQVIRIGHSRRDFVVSCPCIRGSANGQTKLGFGTVEDSGRSIKCPDSAPAPAVWNGEEWAESEDNDMSARNNHEQAMDIALGTYEVLKRGPVFKPFLRIKDVPQNEKYQAGAELYLHAFVTHGYEDGQYDEKLVEVVRGDMLTKKGIKLSDLKPLSQWVIRRVNDKLELKVKGRISREDSKV